MKKIGIILLIASFAASTAGGATIDASNGGDPWVVAALGDPLVASIQLTNGLGDPAKYSCDLELVISGYGTLPTIQSIDLLASGAIFAVTGGYQYPSPTSGAGTFNAFRSVDLTGGTTTAAGLLAQISIDTTGVAPGNYTFAAVSATGGDYTGTKVWTKVDDEYEEIPLTLVSGTIHVVPEPSTIVLSGIAALSLLAFRGWTRRRMRAVA